jgi:signal transduction histidine kinase/ActR/RegA family two-component response regulator
MFLSNLKYREKIFFILLLVFSLISSGLYIVYRVSYGSLLEEQRGHLGKTSMLTAGLISRKENEMGNLARMFQNNRTLTENLYIHTVLGGEREPVMDYLKPFYISLKVDSLILYDSTGRSILVLDTRPGEDLEYGGHAVKEHFPDDVFSGFKEAYGTVKIMGSAPLIYASGIVGYISLGKYIDSEFLDALKEISGSEFLFIVGGRIAASTLEADNLEYRPSGGKLKMAEVVYSVSERQLKDPDGRTVGVIVTAVSNERLNKSLSELKMYMLGLLGVSVFVSFVFFVLFIKALVNPLGEIVHFIGKVEKGEFGGELKVEGRDEIAELSGHFNKMQGQLKAQRDALESYTGSLEKAIEERTKELEKIQRQLLQSQKMESLGALASGIAHDFNNLLSAILGYASFVKEQIDAGHPHYRYWDIVEQAALRGTELTGNLLTFAGRKSEKEKKNVDINRLVIELMRLLARIFPKSISFETKLSEESLYVLGNGNALYQTLMNICINAKDAMPAGGRLIIETSDMAVEKDFPLMGRSGRFVQINITDTGIGMRKEMADRIFEPFYTTKESGRGTGLGLAIVYGIVHEHEGFINVYSEPGRGTSFKIYLPASKAEEAEEKEETPKLRASRPGQSILVVDDEEPIRRLSKEILDASDYKVLLASDGAEALNIFERSHKSISLVLLDLVMPGMGGHDIFRRLKAIEPGVKVVITTGFSPEIGLQWIKEEGVKGFIQKPFRARDLLETVKAAIGD